MGWEGDTSPGTLIPKPTTLDVEVLIPPTPMSSTTERPQPGPGAGGGGWGGEWHSLSLLGFDSAEESEAVALMGSVAFVIWGFLSFLSKPNEFGRGGPSALVDGISRPSGEGIWVGSVSTCRACPVHCRHLAGQRREEWWGCPGSTRSRQLTWVGPEVWTAAEMAVPQNKWGAQMSRTGGTATRAKAEGAWCKDTVQASPLLGLSPDPQASPTSGPTLLCCPREGRR